MTIVKSLKSFINDVAMSVGGDAPSFDHLVQCAQTQLQWWTQLIRASGGQLNPQKCYCTTYTWVPDQAGILCLSLPAEVNISPCSQNLQQTIPVLKPHEGTQYLGVYLTSNGDTKPMQHQLWRKAILYTEAFQQTHMSPHEASILYRSCFLPALTYPFPAMGLPSTFLERIHKLSASTILNKMGFHQNSHAVLFLLHITLEESNSAT